MSFYNFSEYAPPIPPLAPYFSFILAHLQSANANSNNNQSNQDSAVDSSVPIQKDNLTTISLKYAFENDLQIIWESEDYTFQFPIPKIHKSNT